jgi:hypothetical protein
MKEEKNKPNESSVFHEAAMESSLNKLLAKSEEDKPAIVDNRAVLLAEIKRRIEDGKDDQWAVLKNMIDTHFTERFILAMNDMSDKEFVRNYLKLIEHFKPKLIRADPGTTEVPDNVIHIETMIINERGEQEIIDITSLQDKDEDL